MSYKRIVLKLSGEVLGGTDGYGINKEQLLSYIKEIKAVYEAGYEIIVMIGGGNIWRGAKASKIGISKAQSDHMGMLATMINAVSMHASLCKAGLPARLMSRLGVDNIAEYYSVEKAKNHLKKGRIVVIGGGTSNPCFTTDSAASLTAIELEADLLIKGTKVDGVYTKDPTKHADATRYTSMSLQEALEKRVGVMDMTALLLCKEGGVSIAVYNATCMGQLLKLLKEGEGGTFMHN